MLSIVISFAPDDGAKLLQYLGLQLNATYAHLLPLDAILYLLKLNNLLTSINSQVSLSSKYLFRGKYFIFNMVSHA